MRDTGSGATSFSVPANVRVDDVGLVVDVDAGGASRPSPSMASSLLMYLKRSRQSVSSKLQLTPDATIMTTDS